MGWERIGGAGGKQGEEERKLGFTGPSVIANKAHVKI